MPLLEWGGTQTRQILKLGTAAFFVSSHPNNEDLNPCTTAWAGGAQELASWCVMMACWKPETTKPHEAHRRKLSIEQTKLRCLPRHFTHFKRRDMYTLPIKIPIFRFLANSILFYSHHTILPYRIYSILFDSILLCLIPFCLILFYSGCMHSTTASTVQICAIRSETQPVSHKNLHNDSGTLHTSDFLHSSTWVVHNTNVTWASWARRPLVENGHNQLLSSLPREHGRLQSNRMA